MKAFLPIALVALLGTCAAHGARTQWKIVSMGKGGFVIENTKNKKLRHKIRSQDSNPRYIGMHRVKRQNIVLLVYFSGSAGTGEVVDIYRTVVFNTKSRKFYGDFPFRVESSLPGKSWPDTVFTFKKNHFTVADANTHFKTTINY